MLKLAVGEPRSQPLHVAVTQQAARVEDAGERQETGEAQHEYTVGESNVNESTGEMNKQGGNRILRHMNASREDLRRDLLARA